MINIKYLIIILLFFFAGAKLTNGQKLTENAIIMQDTIRDIEEVVDGQFFKVNKDLSVSAISVVQGELLYKTPAANLSNTLQGNLQGLTTLQRGAEPGFDAATFHIRGLSSYNAQQNVIFVDGFQVPFDYFQYLTASEIESISILKDAASLSAFGMKGANGILWIKTKRGYNGKNIIELQTRTGWGQPVLINKPLKSYDYAKLINEAISNDNNRIWSPRYSDSDIQEYASGIGHNTDWYNEVLKDNSIYSNTDLSIRGGNENAKYYAILGYFKNNGLYNVKNDDIHANISMEQFNVRANLDFNMLKIFEGKVDIGGRTETRKFPNYNGYTLWNNLARYPSNIYPAVNEDGTYPGNTLYPDNPLASIRELGYKSTHDRTLLANFLLKEKLDFITPGLYLSQGTSFNTWTRGTYSVTKDYMRTINGVPQTTNQETNYSVFDDKGTNQWNWTQFTATIGYERIRKKNQIKSAINYLHYLYKVDASLNGQAGVNMNYAFQNLSSRIYYAYNEKYITELSAAYSGSDNYRKGNRFGLYPALSVGWIMSNESFLKNNSFIDFLKIRLSAGKTGYDEFSGGRYLYQLYFKNSSTYPTGQTSLTWNETLTQAYVPNPNIFAEQTTMLNAGLDLNLIKKIDFIIDAYLNKRSGIVTSNNTLMATFGTTPPFENIGKVTSSGLEASVKYKNYDQKFKYQLGAMGAYTSNVIDFMAEIPPASPLAAQTGNSLWTQFGYLSDGFYDLSDFDNNGDLLPSLPFPSFGAVQPGDIKYKDLNNDKIIDNKDITVIGKPSFPKLTYSFDINLQYKGFDFFALIYGVAGREVNLLMCEIK